VKPDEVESQLSAMFDGELPAAECELLSRRIDRDEKLRARWTRYVLIGASMRYEPVATATAGFASRVGAAVAALDRAAAEAAGSAVRARRTWLRGPTLAANLLRAPRLVWQSALAAALVVAVAGLSITMLRYATLSGTVPTLTAGHPSTDPHATLQLEGAQQRRFGSSESLAAAPPALSPNDPAAWSYVTPSGNERASSPVPLRSELADYIVAHSDYSTPLMRPDLLSALVSGEQGVEESSGVDDASAAGGASSSAVMASSTPDTGATDAATAASPAHP
jgi:sigma-E factor negative regulatory protein RseA